MAITLNEVSTLHNRLIIEHGIDVIELATTFSWAMRSSRSSPVVIQKHMTTLVKCVNARLKELGVSRTQFERAMKDLERTNQTIDIINAIPD